MRKNYDLVLQGFDIVHPLLAEYIGREFIRVYGTDWWDAIRDALSDQKDVPVSGEPKALLDSLDLMNCLRLIDRRWRDVFRTKLGQDHRTWANELVGVRNKVAHIGTTDLPQPYAERALDTMALFCEALDAKKAGKIRALYRTLRYNSEDGSMATSVVSGPTKSTANEGVMTTASAAHLPSWRDVMQPHPDVAQGRYRTAEFAADLAQVSRSEGAVEYKDPVEFFARTYVTKGMSDLLVNALQRLSGKGGEPVIQLKTAFGGGKTHSMLALYHLVHSHIDVDRIPNVKPILEKAGLQELPKVHVAVLVGTALDPAHTKRPANLPKHTVNTLWGEMAYQLVTSAGRRELYRIISDADRRGVSPGSEALKTLLNECGPCLILMDELVAYARKIYGVPNLPAGSYENFITFIQEITEAARASDNSIVVASIPESNIEIGGDAGKQALAAIEHTFGRMESIWKPVAASEGFEVVRRRLFLDCRDPEARERVCRAFSQMYQDNAADFPSETKELAYQDRMISCYPIHPEVFDRLYDDWATLERFQRTRGVLRLMAAVIHALWMANDSSAMIMPGSLPLNTPAVRDELVRYLPETWNSIIDTQVDGKNSIPYQKDQAIPRYGIKLAARRVARTIMLGSAPSTAALRDKTIRGLETSSIRLGVVQPGESIADFNDALTTLRDSLSYLYSNQNGTRFWYDTKPTLRKTAEDRATQVSEEDALTEIESRLRRLRGEGPFTKIHACPASSQDIPDEKTARLVLLKPQTTFLLQVNRKNSGEALTTVENFLNTRGSSPRIYRNMLAFVGPDEDKLRDLTSEVKRLIAWKSIKDDKDDLNLDASQTREVDNQIKRSNAQVDTKLKEAYCWLFVPFIDKSKDLKTIQWEISNLGGGDETIVSKASHKMREEEQLITKWAPALLTMCLDDVLWKNTDDIKVEKLWNDLCTYCYLPRLTNFAVLENAMIEGVRSTEFFGIAAGYTGDRYIDLTLHAEISSVHESNLLVKPAVAIKQLMTSTTDTGRTPGQPGTSPHPDDTGSGGTSSPSSGYASSSGTVAKTTPAPKNRRFFMSAPLDNTRINKNVNDYLTEIIQHLLNVDGAKVEVTLEVNVTVPDGIPSSTVRTVSENCRTLKIKDFGFEDT